MRSWILVFMMMCGFVAADTINHFDTALQILCADEDWEDAEVRASFMMASDDLENQLQGAFAAAYIAYQNDHWLEARWWMGKVENILYKMRKEALECKDCRDD